MSKNQGSTLEDWLPQAVLELAYCNARRFYSKAEPTLMTYPFLSTSPEGDKDGQGPFKDLYDELMDLMVPLRTSDGLWYETQNWYNIRRNAQYGSKMHGYISGRNFTPTAKLYVSVSTWKRLLKHYGFHSVSRGQIPDVFAISIPKYQASNGITYMLVGGLMYLLSGMCGKTWAVTQQGARELVLRIASDERLAWKMSYKTIKQVIKDYFLFHIGFARWDNPHSGKPRLLFCPPKHSYIVQRMLAFSLSEQVKELPFFITKTEKAEFLYNHHASHGVKEWLNLDFSRYDFHRTPQSSWNLRKAIWEVLYQRSAGEDLERVAVFNAIVNLYAPLLYDVFKKKHLCGGFLQSTYVPKFIWKKGVAASGAGDFPDLNTIYGNGITALVALQVDPFLKGYEIEDLEISHIPSGLGDNLTQPSYGKVEIVDWVNGFKEYNLVLKPEETKVSGDHVFMLRKIHTPFTGEVEPSVLSLAHKALFPGRPLEWEDFYEDPKTGWQFSSGELKDNHVQIERLKYAIGSRARRAILRGMLIEYAGTEKYKGYSNLVRYFDKNIIQPKLLMSEHSYLELSRLLTRQLGLRNELGEDVTSPFLEDLSYLLNEYGISIDSENL